jgi:hypothetical protein
MLLFLLTSKTSGHCKHGVALLSRQRLVPVHENWSAAVKLGNSESQQTGRMDVGGLREM